MTPNGWACTALTSVSAREDREERIELCFPPACELGALARFRRKMSLDPTSEKLCINNCQRSRGINDLRPDCRCAPYAAFLPHPSDPTLHPPACSSCVWGMENGKIVISYLHLTVFLFISFLSHWTDLRLICMRWWSEAFKKICFSCMTYNSQRKQKQFWELIYSCLNIFRKQHQCIEIDTKLFLLNLINCGSWYALCDQSNPSIQ